MALPSICHCDESSPVETESVAEFIVEGPLVVDAVASLARVARISGLHTQPWHNPVPLAAIVVAFERELHEVADR